MLKFLTRRWCVAMLFSVLAVAASAVPSAPAGLNTASITATSFTLRWSASTGGTGGIAGYDVLRDGVFIGSTSSAVRTLAVTGLAPTTAYSMTVVSRDGTGSASPVSAALTVTTLSDTTVPTKPMDLAATAITTTSCALTWTGSTDNVGVTGYNVYRSGLLLGSTSGMTLNFDVGGLSPDTNNSLTVRATDAAGNLSAASVALTVRTLALPPSSPTGLAVTALKATSFTLTWAASSGGTGGIAGYDIYQNGALIGSTATARTLAITGLAPTTTYSMTVTSRDTLGNISPASSLLDVNTPADTTIPTRPADLAAAGITTTSFMLTWTGSTDNVGVTGYNIYRSGMLLGTTSATTYEVTNLIPDSTNNITVRAVDAAGNLSSASIALSVRMVALPPSIPNGLVITNLKPASFTLQWTASTGGTGGITGYEVYLNDLLIGSPAVRSLTLAGLIPVTSYTMTVASRDSAGNISAPSAPLVVTTPADTTKPTVPKGLSAADVTTTSFTLTWTASTDNVGVTGYDIYRNNVLIGATSNTGFSVAGLAPSTLSSMRLKARDAAGNISVFSAILAVTTSAPPNAAPAITLTSPADGSSVTLPFTLTLSATAADSDGTISKVEFYDNGVLLGETATPASPNTFTFPLTFISSGSHSLTARATDNRNATTDSTPVIITVNNPNESPSVTLTAPASVSAPAFITLTADAIDSDGTITKVEFYEGSNLLGEVLAPTTLPSTFTFPLTLYSVGSYTITSVATDNSSTRTTSVPVVVNVNSGAAAVPFVSNFEPTEGYRPGSLNGQLSWFATGGVTVAPSVTPGSQQELSISAAQPAEIFSHNFSAEGVSPIFVDFSAQPVAGADPASAIVFSTPAAQVALVGTTSPAALWIFNGGGLGWTATSQTIPTDATGRTLDWIRLTTREDYLTKKWDIYLNGTMVVADIPFADPAATALTDFSVNGHATVASAFDNFYAGPENPLFADADHDGMDDAWETAHGLNPALNDRDADRDADGVTNLLEFLLSTDPNNADTDGDGLPDGWERQYGLNPLAAADATLDSDGDGRNNLQEFQDGTNPGVADPNQKPLEVGITDPISGKIFPLGSDIMFTAVATGGTSGFAKAEFFAGETKLGESLSPPLQFTWSGVTEGQYSVTARVTDDAGLTVSSPPVTVRVATPLPVAMDFETSEGYNSGALNGQNGWVASDGVTVTGAVAEIGLLGVSVPANATPLSVTKYFPQPANQPIIFAEFYANGKVAATAPEGLLFDMAGARVSLVKNGYFAEFHVFDGNGVGGGSWRRVEYNYQIDLRSETTLDWTPEFGLRFDFTIRKWDLTVDGLVVAADLGLADNGPGFLDRFTLYGSATQAASLDTLQVGFGNFSFTDADRDNMDDDWEQSNGLDPSLNDRDGDGDGDGLTNIHEFIAGTDLTNADSDGDGLTDGFEVRNGFDPWTYTFPIDEDEDGVSQIQEAINGTDPLDYFNGEEPVITILSGEGSPTGEFVVRVHKPDGTPYPNAPVTFDVPAEAASLAGNPDSTITHQTIKLRANADGIARVYLRPADPAQ